MAIRTVEYGACPCGRLTALYHCEHLDEYLCEECLNNANQDAAENAWERLCEDFHDGGSTRFPDAERKRQEEARKLK